MKVVDKCKRKIKKLLRGKGEIYENDQHVI